MRRKRGEISTAAGIDFATFDFDDRSVKNVFEAMAHHGGCLNSDDGLRSNTISITISNLERDMVQGEVLLQQPALLARLILFSSFKILSTK